MSKTNDDFIVDYVKSPAYGVGTDKYNARVRHGSLSYQYNVLYSYSCPIAIKFWYEGTEYIAVSFDDYRSNTTNRHQCTLGRNLHRNYIDSQILPVYSVEKYIDASNGAITLGRVEHDIQKLLDEENAMYTWAQCWKRHRLETFIRTVRSLLIIHPGLNHYLDELLSIYNKVDTQEKRDAIYAEKKREELAEAKKLKEEVHKYVLESDDLIFDMLAMPVYSGADIRFRTLIGSIKTKSSKQLKALLNKSNSYDLRELLRTELGYYFAFHPSSNGSIRQCELEICANYQNGFCDSCTGGMTIRLETLFKKYREEGLDMSSRWEYTKVGYSTDRMDNCYVDFIPVSGGYKVSTNQRMLENSFIPDVIFDLLHKFVTTCRELLGAVVYPDFVQTSESSTESAQEDQ